MNSVNEIRKLIRQEVINTLNEGSSRDRLHDWLSDNARAYMVKGNIDIVALKRAAAQAFRQPTSRPDIMWLDDFNEWVDMNY